MIYFVKLEYYIIVLTVLIFLQGIVFPMRPKSFTGSLHLVHKMFALKISNSCRCLYKANFSLN